MDAPADVNAALRRLPKVDDVLRKPELHRLLKEAPHWAIVEAVRGEIDKLRAKLLKDAQAPVEVSPHSITRKVEELLRPSLVAVVNATGVVLHTNLGRAPLHARALERIAETSRGYANLEYKLDERRRGSRHDHVRDLLAGLTGAEDALVVNNGAAAVLLALAAHAAGRAAIVSRGELVEIGGSFRVPDVLRASGVKLVEVGTTNRTHKRDYESAITDETALLLKVHRSNFAVVGFTTEVEPAELAALAHEKKLLALMDLGSGALVSLRSLGLDAEEPSVQEIVRAGIDLVTFSGDKLLGGPQAGLLAGTKSAIAACKQHPLMRAIRPSKLTLGGLEATLELYRDGRAGELPTLAMLSAPEPTLETRARKLAEACRAANAAMQFEPARVKSAVGGGALPLCEPWSWAVAASHPQRSADELDALLRRAEPAVIGRIADGRLLLDVRTVSEHELALIAKAFQIEDRT